MSSFNGSGTFVISGSGLPFVTGTTISSTVANQLNTDLAVGLSTCITIDGQSTPTANIPMGGYKITGLGAPSGNGDALAYGSDAAVGNLTATTLGVGGAFTPGQIIEARLSQNNGTIIQATNGNAGAAAFTSFRGYNGTDIWDLAFAGTAGASGLGLPAGTAALDNTSGTNKGFWLIIGNGLYQRIGPTTNNGSYLKNTKTVVNDNSTVTVALLGNANGGIAIVTINSAGGFQRTDAVIFQNTSASLSAFASIGSLSGGAAAYSVSGGALQVATSGIGTAVTVEVSYLGG